MSQTLTLKRAPAGVDSAKLFVDGTDTLATNGTATSVTPGTNNPTRYSIVWDTNVADGTYQLVLYDGGIAVAGANILISGSTITVEPDNSDVLALLASGSAVSRSPVATNGKLSGPIFIGDAYLDSHGRAFSWLVSPVAGVSVGTVTCKFGGKSKKCPDSYSFLASGTVSLVTIDSVDYWKMKVDLQSSDTVNLIEDVYNWTASLVYSDGKQETKFYGEEWLRKSLTL